MVLGLKLRFKLIHFLDICGLNTRPLSYWAPTDKVPWASNPAYQGDQKTFLMIPNNQQVSVP